MSAKKVIKRVLNGKSFKLLDFHIFDKFPEDDSSEDSHHATKQSSCFTIQMFGMNEHGETACLYVNNYSPFFYVRVGNDWTKNDAQDLLRDLRSKIGNNVNQSIISAELVEHYKLYGFSAGNTHSFVKLTFKNSSSMNKTKGLWYRYLSAKEKAKNPNANYRTFVGYTFKRTSLELMRAISLLYCVIFIFTILVHLGGCL